jgi:hypothetical protein
MLQDYDFLVGEEGCAAPLFSKGLDGNERVGGKVGEQMGPFGGIREGWDVPVE